MRHTIVIIGAAVLAAAAYAQPGVDDRAGMVVLGDELGMASPEAIVLVANRMDPLVGIHADIITVKRTDALMARLVSPPVVSIGKPMPVAHSCGGMPG